jgi:hypothetical protein
VQFRDRAAGRMVKQFRHESMDQAKNGSPKKCEGEARRNSLVLEIGFSNRPGVFKKPLVQHEKSLPQCYWYNNP